MDVAGAVTHIPAQRLESFATAVLAAAGAPESAAAVTAGVLLQASQWGVDTHGIALLPAYVRRLGAGVVAGNASVTVRRTGPATVSVDGGNGLGPVVATRAMAACLEAASETGLCAGTVCNSHHFGAAGVYAAMALPRSMIGVAASNGAPVMAPWGAAAPYLSTNPLAVAVPAGAELPILVDMATSAISRSAIAQRRGAGQLLPEGCALDPNGQPTRDPAVALAGVLLPMAGAKGSALALTIEVLTGLLAAGTVGSRVRELHGDLSGPQGTSHFFLALDVARFLPIQEFQARVDDLVREIKRLRPAAGVDSILLPGESNFRTAAERRGSGIPVPSGLLAELAELGRAAGVPLDR